jgi:hypothetical protein
VNDDPVERWLRLAMLAVLAVALQMVMWLVVVPAYVRWAAH